MPEVSIGHQHSFSYVYPAPADRSFRLGEFPYMLCGCGLKHRIVADELWRIVNGEWEFDLQYPSESVI